MATTTHHIVVQWRGERKPTQHKISDAYRFYTELGGLLSQLEFSAKAKEDRICFYTDEEDERPSVIFTAAPYTKEMPSAWQGVSNMLER